jgi:hypothetical protein
MLVAGAAAAAAALGSLGLAVAAGPAGQCAAQGQLGNATVSVAASGALCASGAPGTAPTLNGPALARAVHGALTGRRRWNLAVAPSGPTGVSATLTREADATSAVFDIQLTPGGTTTTGGGGSAPIKPQCSLTSPAGNVQVSAIGEYCYPSLHSHSHDTLKERLVVDDLAVLFEHGEAQRPYLAVTAHQGCGNLCGNHKDVMEVVLSDSPPGGGGGTAVVDLIAAG